jgi:hypothetical protein
LGQLGKTLAAAAADVKLPPGETPFDEKPLIDAYEAAGAAAASEKLSDAEIAKQMLDALAAAAAAKAQQVGIEPAPEMPSGEAAQGQSQGQSQQPGKPGQPGAQSSGKMGTGAQTTDPRVAKLKELGISLQDWARLPGDLQDEVLNAASDAGPEEYRGLIRRYFQELARRGAADKDASGSKP